MGRKMKPLPPQGGKKAKAKATPEQKKKKKKKQGKDKVGKGKSPAPATGATPKPPQDPVARKNREIQERAGVTATESLWAVRHANDAAIRAAPTPAAPAFPARSARAQELIMARAAGGGGGDPAPVAAASYLKVIRNENEARRSGFARINFGLGEVGVFGPFLPEAVRGGRLKGDELAAALRAASGTGNGGAKLFEFRATFHVQAPGGGGGGGAADARVTALPIVVSVARTKSRPVFRFSGRRWVDLLRAATGHHPQQAGNRSGEATELLGTSLLFERFGGDGRSGGGGGGRSGGPSSSSQQQQEQQPLLLVTAVARVSLPSTEEAIEMWKRGELQGVVCGSAGRGGSRSGGGGAAEDDDEGNGSSESEYAEASDEDGDDERCGGGGGHGGGRGTPAALEQPARVGGKRRLREGEAAGATAAAAAAATPAKTERPNKPRPFPPPLPGFQGDGSGGGRRAVAAPAAPTAAAAAAHAAADTDVPPRSLDLAVPPPTAVSVPIIASLDCDSLKLTAEGSRLFDAAADGALGGAPERAALFAFKQLVLVEVAATEAASAPPAAGAAPPSEAPAPATRLLETVDVDVDRIPVASSSAFLTLGGRGWARVAELLGLAPGAAVRFERDPRTGFVFASRAAR